VSLHRRASRPVNALGRGALHETREKVCSAMRSKQMRALALTAAALAAGLGGCVYDPYYGYAYPDPLVAGAVVGGVWSPRRC
jgi:hypothetical protein